jgi:RNA polymerase sigma factor (sigma-70 family)
MTPMKMSLPELPAEAPATKAAWFTTTHWSVVLAAGKNTSLDSEAALEKLCRAYWYPLYAYVRRQGHSPHDAQDLTQGFFARLLDKNYLAAVAPEKGKFRSFLLAALKHFLANERDRAQTIKRGGKQTFVSLDEETAENRYKLEPATNLTAAMIFERRWALAVLEEALQKLRVEFITSGREAQFNRLKPFLEGDVGRGDYQVAAAELNVTPGAVAMSVQRLRQRYRELVRLEVSQTVADPSEVDPEMRHLLAVLAQ